ncbi:hypothetical protein V8F20_008892 [Naviculisporaceae sp. PSN 640]
MGSWAGTGPIVTGSCSMAAWSLFDLSTAYLWAPVIGCLQDKPDCCPSSFVFASMTAPPPSIKTEAISVTTSSASNAINYTSITTSTGLASGAAPTATVSHSALTDLNPCLLKVHVAAGGLCYSPLEKPGAALLARDDAAPHSVSNCPEDYSSVGNTGCCPYGMAPTSNLGIVPVCATTLPSPFPAPRVKVTGLSSDKPISTATDAIYALQYQIYTIVYPPPAPDANSGLSTGAKAGIGASCGFLAIVLLGALIFFIRRRRRVKLGIQERGRSGNSERATTIVGGSYLDPEGNEKKDNDPVVGGRAELGTQDAQVDVQRYELPAADAVTVTPMETSQVYMVVPTQDGVYQYQPVQQGQQQQLQSSYGVYQASH